MPLENQESIIMLEPQNQVLRRTKVNLNQNQEERWKNSRRRTGRQPTLTRSIVRKPVAIFEQPVMKFNKPIGINENIPQDVQTLLSVGGRYLVKSVALAQCLTEGIGQLKSKWTNGRNRSKSKVALEYESNRLNGISTQNTSSGTYKIPTEMNPATYNESCQVAQKSKTEQ